MNGSRNQFDVWRNLFPAARTEPSWPWQKLYGRIERPGCKREEGTLSRDHILNCVLIELIIVYVPSATTTATNGDSDNLPTPLS